LKEKYELSLTPVAIQNPGWKQGSPSSVEAGFSGKVNGAEVHPVGDAIAIVGMSGRFPQADTLDEFWENLISGRNVFTEFPMSRGPVNAGSRFQGGFLKDIECFDAKFFGLSVREAALMDPHQRLFLETTWAAIEDAGYEPGKLAGSKTGVWVGMYSPDFNQRISGAMAVDSESLLGRLNVMVANRVSYLLDLRGPSEIVDTACSSSLVAIDRAIQSLRSGECEMAIAGGVSLLLSAVSTEWLGSVEMLSSAGICRPFDGRANGLVRGEGVGAVLLKPLRNAIRDADHIYAVIRGSGTNHNGRREGSLTTPSLSAQADLLVQTYSSAAIDPQTIDYIEAHGAASELGDYVEINAYKRAFARLAPQMPKDSCGIGTVKANIGALDSAGGIAALIKVVLAFQKQQWPGMSGDLKIRPDFELAASPFYFVEKTEAWVQKKINGKPVPRRAGVHAFGLGGVNAHIVLEEYIQEKRADGNNQETQASRRTVSPAASRFARRRFPLPYKAAGSQFTTHALLDTIQPRPGGAVIRTRFSASDPLMSDHRVHGTPVVAAALMCETVHMAAAVFGLGRVYRMKGICFPNSLQITDSNSQIEACLEFEVTGLSACFKLRSDLDGVHAEGTVEWTEVSRWLDERIDILEKRTGQEIDSEQFYARFEKLGITYGSLYRTVQSVTYNETEAFARVSLPPGFESESTGFGVHPGLLDAVLQLSSVFSQGGTDCIHLPFCIESLEWRGPVASNGFVFLRKLASGDGTALHRFDGGIADATGRIIAVLKDICLKSMTENRKDSLESILKRVADGTLSVEAADRLLSDTSPKQSSSVESFAARLSSRYPTAEFTFKLSLDGEMWSIDVKKGTSNPIVDSACDRAPIIKLSRIHFEQLLAGECDPTVLFLRGAIELSPENAHALKQKIGGCWFEKFNAKRLPIRFRDLLAGTLYAHGEVVLASGLKRELFPWTISAEAGAILYEMILREKPERTLEIGMAYGLSSLFICQAHHDKGGGDHVAIDPCQREEFLAIGLHNIEKAGLSRYLRFIEQPDYVALPLILAEGKPYQFVFIDGLHMFDYTILDFFYCDRLLTEDGILFFDDCLAPGVAKVVEYVRSNRRYEPLVINCERLAGFRKKANDLRSLEDPNFHREF
ncbi:MAG: fabF, partial [Verrucomicrobiales bacterium]|nr:fabF [Verrucomicrobiales bacterium]